MKPSSVSFPVFFLLWAEVQGWTVPNLHIRICEWLEGCLDRNRVLLVFRGAAKSTIFAVYKAWSFHCDPTHRAQIWAADDDVAGRMTRDTLNVLRRHPLTQGIVTGKAGALSFSVVGATDARNPSMSAIGVNSNATSSRADDVDFDDVEVPKNIRSQEARLNLRQKISESTHILVPGGRKTYIGTPHTHDSLYSEEVNSGAALLKIPLFKSVARYQPSLSQRSFALTFPVEHDGLTVIAGIGKGASGKGARVLSEGIDYHLAKGAVTFFKPPNTTLDICTGNAWPDYFTRAEVEFRRRECKTFNEWDSQYQLESLPVGDVRLDPDRMRVYDLEPEIREVAGAIAMMLGNVQIVGASCYWDCSLGKIKSDASALCLLLTDARGTLYWHRATGLVGELATFDEHGKLVEGQCQQVRDLVVALQIPRVTVEVNGVGGFVPPILRRALAGTGCAVAEQAQSADKRKRILDAFEPPLSSRFLWIHESVANGPAYGQMRDFRPDVRSQPDDYLDAAAGAIAETPMRIGKLIHAPGEKVRDEWRPGTGTVPVTFER